MIRNRISFEFTSETPNPKDIFQKLLEITNLSFDVSIYFNLDSKKIEQLHLSSDNMATLSFNNLDIQKIVFLHPDFETNVLIFDSKMISLHILAFTPNLLWNTLIKVLLDLGGNTEESIGEKEYWEFLEHNTEMTDSFKRLEKLSNDTLDLINLYGIYLKIKLKDCIESFKEGDYAVAKERLNDVKSFEINDAKKIVQEFFKKITK